LKQPLHFGQTSTINRRIVAKFGTGIGPDPSLNVRQQNEKSIPSEK
jgi:hypothetical protein